ncbi:unnamed protein product [Linum tenue]|uniref:Uncharacterized protein n=1 Tax=Linum tenue TaxID=586396 RepID=A0AAV0RWJ4_9ROSI|nr:unnamed protein product [Linum tenue]
MMRERREQDSHLSHRAEETETGEKERTSCRLWIRMQVGCTNCGMRLQGRNDAEVFQGRGREGRLQRRGEIEVLEKRKSI